MADAPLEAALSGFGGGAGDVPDALLVGLSGGLDSTVLLHALCRLRQGRGLRAIHVHHGLLPQADAWSEHCQRVCDELGIELVTARVRVDAGSAHGPEGAARAARYEAFAQALQPGESLVLAHHQQDQAETVLLRLLRASGSTGLAGMRAEREFAGHRLLRPLLQVPREALVGYAQRHRLHWCEDPSNADAAADRNFLRLRVLPLLRERWPQADAALAGSAAQLAQDASLLEEATLARLHALGGDQDWLPVAPLVSMDPAWRARILRAWVASRGVPPLPGGAPQRIAEEVLAAGHDRAARYRWQDVELRRWRDRIYLAAWQAPQPGWALAWDGGTPLSLPDGSQLRFEGPAPVTLGSEFGPCRVQSRRGGERLRLPGRAHRHTLKHALQASGMPPWERERLPLLVDASGELLAAGDALLSDRLQAWCGRHRLRLRWLPADAPRD